jgi:hypothetical protein
MADYVPVYDTTLHRWKLVALADIAGNMTAVQIVQVLQSAFGRLTWLLSGNSEGGEPDTATAAALAAFIAQTGVNPDYVNWLDMGELSGAGSLVIADAYSGSFADALTLALAGGALTIADAYSGSFADAVTLALAGGSLTIADAFSASFADNVTLANADVLLLVIADAYSASSAEEVTLAFAGGDLVIADAYSSSSSEAVVLALAGGSLVIADAYSASSAENVVLTVGSPASQGADFESGNMNGWVGEAEGVDVPIVDPTGTAVNNTADTGAWSYLVTTGHGEDAEETPVPNAWRLAKTVTCSGADLTIRARNGSATTIVAMFVDGISAGEFNVSSGAYTTFSFPASAGSHLIEFLVYDTNTAIITNVYLDNIVVP